MSAPTAHALDLAYRELLTAVQASASLSEVAELVAQHARTVLDADGASVTEVRGESYLYLAVAGAPVPAVGQRHPLAGSFTGRTVLSGAPGVFRRADAAPGSRARAEAEGIASGLIAPVIVSGRVIGTVGATSSRDAAFSDQDVVILSGFAAFLASSLHLIERRRGLPSGSAVTVGIGASASEGPPAFAMGVTRVALDTLDNAARALAASELQPYQLSLAELIVRTSEALRGLLGVDPN